MDARFLVLQSSHDRHLHVNLHADDGKIGVGTNLLDGNLSSHIGNDEVAANGSLNGRVEAFTSVDAKFSARRDHIRAHVRANSFVGATVSGDIGLDIAGVRPQAQATVSYGWGYKAEVDATISLERMHFSTEFDASFGLGGGVKLEIEVNPTKMLHHFHPTHGDEKRLWKYAWNVHPLPSLFATSVILRCMQSRRMLVIDAGFHTSSVLPFVLSFHINYDFVATVVFCSIISSSHPCHITIFSGSSLPVSSGLFFSFRCYRFSPLILNEELGRKANRASKVTSIFSATCYSLFRMSAN